MINVVQSHRIEQLLGHIQSFLGQKKPVDSSQTSMAVQLFKEQPVIVPSIGVGSWLKQKIAEQTGVCIQVKSELLGAYQWRLYTQALRNKVPDRTPLSAAAMRWRIFSYLTHALESNALSLEEQEKLQGLFSCFNEPDDAGTGNASLDIRRQLWVMSGQIAQVFSYYVVHRPDWLDTWGKNKRLDIEALLKDQYANQLALRKQQFSQAIQGAAVDKTPEDSQGVSAWQIESIKQLEQWQQLLWLRLFNDVFEARQKVTRQFWEALAQDRGRHVLPERLVVFGMVRMPEADLAFLQRLGNYTEILILHFNPSQEYWADLVDPRWAARMQLPTSELTYKFQTHLNYETAHPLLIRLGKQSRDVFKLLTHLSGGESGEWIDEFEENQRQNSPMLLKTVQHSILNLTVPKAHSIDIEPQDESLQIHVCHSMLRQLEVLRESLTRWLAADATRTPADILIIVPNLEQHAPLVRSVFAHRQDLPSINVQITGVMLQQTHTIWQALLGRFDLLNDRFDYQAFLDWLSLEPIQAYYDLTGEDIARLGVLLAETGFKRGFDAAHLAPMLDVNDHDTRFTLYYALNRLILGLVMPTRAAYAHVLAFEDIQPDNDAELISTLHRIYTDLDHWRMGINSGARPVRVWLEQIGAHLTALAGKNKELMGFDLIRGIISEITQHLAVAENTRNEQRMVAELPLRFVLDQIETELRQNPAVARPNGGVMFTEPNALRLMPARLIALLGLEPGQFPVQEAPRTFDLIAKLPGRVGDRARLDDERGAFLEALMLAGESFWLFYNGYVMEDTEPRPPSGVIQELLDFLVPLIQPDEDAQATQNTDPMQRLRQTVIWEHTLYPFDAANFTIPDAPLRHQRSFDPLWFKTANLRQTATGTVLKSFSLSENMLNEGPTSAQEAQLTFILSDLMDTAKSYLRHQQVHYAKEDEVPDVVEPLTINHLDKYFLKTELLEQNREEQILIDRYQDMLPIGPAGHAQLINTRRETNAYKVAITQVLAGFNKSAIDETTEHKISLHTLEPASHLQLMAHMPKNNPLLWAGESLSSGNGGKYILRTWLEHLAWQIQRQTSTQDVETGHGYSLKIYAKKIYLLAPVEHTQAQIWLLNWLRVREYAIKQPWLLMPALILADGMPLNLDKTTVQDMQHCVVESRDFKRLLNKPSADSVDEIGSDPYIKRWRGEDYQHYQHAQEASFTNPDWQLILKHIDDKALLRQQIKLYALKLYRPILEHMVYGEFTP